jgi:RimJ/RimL family protein N-acetyltransferase
MREVQTFTAGDGSKITLRPAESGDSCEILDTIRSNALERSYILMEQYGKDAPSERDFIESLDRDKNLLIVAVSDLEIVGCLAALQADGGQRDETAHILHVGLHLREERRGLGIGSKVLSYAVNWAKEKGFRKMEASIFTPNRRSLHLFKKAGFKEEGIRKHRIRIGSDFIDEVLVGKILR